MIRRNNNATVEEDQENPGIQRPPTSGDEPYRYLCLIVSFPGVILLGIAAALTIFLVALKSKSDGPVQTFSPTPSDPLWFDVSGENDDISFSVPTPIPTPQTPSSLMKDNNNNVPTRATPTPSHQIKLPSLSPSALITVAPTQEEIFLQNARTRFQEILKSRTPTITFQHDSNSPQAKALNWLVRDPEYYFYSEDRLVQRWVLATFAFGMVGHNAFSQQLSVPQAIQNWAQYTDECSRWFYTLGDDRNTNLCNEDGMYIRLDLRIQNLSGTIPSEIALMSNHLRYIHLFDNRIHGTLPSELGMLTNLERLELTKNAMNGVLPTELGYLTELRFLGLGRNSFSGPLPSEMGKLTRLNTAGLEWNQFTEIPTELGSMTDTRILNLDNNSISGTIPETLGQLTELETLNLDSNNISGTVPQTLGQLTELKKMDLSVNRGLVGTIPDAVCALNLDILRADCSYLNCSCCTECNYYR